MSKPDPSSDEAQLRAYIRRLENPHATGEVTLVAAPVAEAPMAKASANDDEARARAHVRDLQHPYAALQVEGMPEETLDVSGRESASASATDSEAVERRPSVSKDQFRRRCRGIFEQYIPPAEKGRLRQTHRDFIDRNENRSGEERHRLLVALQRYDLSSVPGLKPQFNREREALTAEKLAAIEAQLLEKK